MFLRQSRQSGFSLIELMVAMVVGLFVAAIVTTMYVSIIRANSTTVQLSRLNMDMQAALDIIARDIQRAGYVSGAEAALARDTSGSSPTSAALATHNTVINASFSAFTIASGALTSTAKDLSVDKDCILIRYDADGNGTISGNDPPEIMRYKYNPNTHSIIFTKWSNIGDQNCNGLDGDSLVGGDGNLNITGLTFSILPTSGASSSFHQRSIIIAVSAASKKDAEIDMSLEKEVRLRNDQFIE